MNDHRKYPPAIRAFLSAISVQPNITRAARAAATVICASKPESIDRVTQQIRIDHHRRMRSDPEYAEAFTASRELGIQSMEDWACDRAMNGWDEDVYYEGVVCGQRRKISERILLRFLETNLPHTWGKKQIELSGELQHRGVASLTDEELERIVRGGSSRASTETEPLRPAEDLLPGHGPAEARTLPETP